MPRITKGARSRFGVPSVFEITVLLCPDSQTCILLSDLSIDRNRTSLLAELQYRHDRKQRKKLRITSHTAQAVFTEEAPAI
jgi:hypothetical protein